MEKVAESEKSPKIQLESILKRTNCSVVLSGSMITSGILTIILKNWFIHLFTTTVLTLSPHSPIGAFWLSHPIPIPTDFFFYNWTNHQDFNDSSIKPKFQETGPYQFRQKMNKVNVIWNDNNTVTFNQMRWFDFDEENSNGGLSDKIVTLNAISMMAAHYIKKWNYVIRKAASVIIGTLAPTAHITRTINQLVFEGYDDPFVELANYIPFIATEIPRFDRFGWLLIRNGSESFDGTFNMDTGVNNDFEVRSWNYLDRAPTIDGACGEVHGSLGEFFSRNLQRDFVNLFVPDICRSVKLDYKEDVVVKGIVGYKYIVGDSVLDNGTLFPENKCYCGGECLPSGMINISSCRYGLPTFLSPPHFYNADPIYLDAVEGLHPNKSLHEGYIILEPNTGIPLQASIGMQLNIFVYSFPDVAAFQNIPTLFFPLLWVRQQAIIPNDAAFVLHVYLNAAYIITGTGLLLIAIGIYILVFKVYRSSVLNFCKKNDYKQQRAQSPEEAPLQLEEKLNNNHYNLVYDQDLEEFT